MRKTTILAIAYLPYYLNDFANILVTGYPAWLAIDYGQRFLILGFLFFMLARGELTKADLGLVPVPVRRFALWTVGTVAASMVYLYLSEFVLAPYFPKGALGGVPIDMDSSLFLLDVTFGLALVGFSEEIVCRGLTLSTLKGKVSTPVLYLVSALLFSLMHWSLSAHTLTDAFIYGLIFVPATLATGSIWPATVTHFLVNFVLYSL
ncbi:CPBP family intramembrane glutamic endopeptidase [uncultured Pseudodesulfovibrio sp.]|uniref:CPBP family intramembrane glutamic endopeptidase n=1 Tax=uncultured Pseudodesulfovibrio sp. TaxID=2035858 RepID=UPI0029C8EE85|nr:CPBP family intramembrane glutamic endopeptidase [uncultured Pseudodesulfovibrio sp.]